MPAITFVIYVAGGLHSHIIYSFFEQVFYPHSYTWGRTWTCVKGEFDAPCWAAYPSGEAKASDYIQYLTKAFIVSSM